VVKRRRLHLTGEHNKKKITDLKNINNQLMQDILRERHTSNKLVDEAMSEARKLSSEALEMIRDANLKTLEANNQIISERSKSSAKIQEEQLFHSRESATLRRKLVNTIDKLNCEQKHQ